MDKSFYTCDEFEAVAPSLGPCELIDGRIVPMLAGGIEHNLPTGNFYWQLRKFVDLHKLGLVLTNETGMHVQYWPPRSRGADVLFVSKKRLPNAKKLSGFLRVPPELIVEVKSDPWKKIRAKVLDYHRFGVDMAWVADPKTRTVRIFPRDGAEKTIPPNGTIDGGEILPGFRMKIAKFFE
jgi:Uma2 family endonuclease